MFGTYRLILACLVALSHFGLVIHGFNPGQWAVLSFYVLSGFLMEIQFRKLGASRRFYLDRFLRIYPLFLAVVLLAAAVLRPQFGDLILNSCLFPLNYTAFTHAPILVSPTWSLACEAHFYLLVPLFARSSTSIIRTIALASIGFFAISPSFPHPDFWAYVGLPGILFAFLSGMLICRKDLRFLRLLGSIMAVLLVVFAISKLGRWGWPTGIHINLCLGYLFALPIVQWLALRSPKIVWDQNLGLLSYPLFLAHDPAARYFALHFKGANSFTLLLWSLFVSVILLIVIERPFDLLRYKIRKKF